MSKESSSMGAQLIFLVCVCARARVCVLYIKSIPPASILFSIKNIYYTPDITFEKNVHEKRFLCAFFQCVKTREYVAFQFDTNRQYSLSLFALTALGYRGTGSVHC